MGDLGVGTRGEALRRCMAARSPEEWMRLRCVPSDAPGMHTGALLCRGPPPAAASCPAPQSIIQREKICQIDMPRGWSDGDKGDLSTRQNGFFATGHPLTISRY